MTRPGRTADTRTQTARAVLILAALVCNLLAAPAARAAMFGYMTDASGIYRINTLTGAATLLYSGAPFNGATVAAGSGQRPSDGMLFFTFDNITNQPVYRWDPATPATAPVLLGNTGGAVPYLHRLAFHPTSGVLYALDINGTNIWSINQTTGAATNVSTITGFPGAVSGDIGFEPGTNNLYAVTYSGGTLRVYLVPLGGGAATQTGTITGMPAGANTVTSTMFNSAGTMFLGGSVADGGGNYNLYTAPVTGGAATTIGSMGNQAQDYGGVPAPPPQLAKSFAPSVVGTNSNSVLTLTLTNTYANAVRGAAVTDTYPAGVVNAPTPGGATTCGGAVTAVAGGNSVALTGGTIPASGSCTVTVNVRSAAVGSYANSVAAGGLTTILGFSDSAASATLTVALPNISVAKAASIVSDPFNGATNPKRIPGSFVDYTITVSNTGTGPADSNTVVITEPIPANTELFVNDLGGAGSGPVAFTDGAPTSGMTYTFTSLASAADDVSFSNDGGATYTYTPVPNGNGVDPTVTHININPKGTFQPTSSFQVRFRVRVK